MTTHDCKVAKVHWKSCFHYGVTITSYILTTLNLDMRCIIQNWCSLKTLDIYANEDN